METKSDLTTRKDIENLINTFYEKVKVDTTIGFFFTDVVQVNWEKHLPIMYDFWEGVLFGKTTYTGNPIAIHSSLNAKYSISDEHFQRWVHLFNSTVDELFSGNKAELTKQRALSIATVMQIKIAESKQ